MDSPHHPADCHGPTQPYGLGSPTPNQRNQPTNPELQMLQLPTTHQNNNRSTDACDPRRTRARSMDRQIPPTTGNQGRLTRGGTNHSYPLSGKPARTYLKAGRDVAETTYSFSRIQNVPSKMISLFTREKPRTRTQTES